MWDKYLSYSPRRLMRHDALIKHEMNGTNLLQGVSPRDAANEVVFMQDGNQSGKDHSGNACRNEYRSDPVQVIGEATEESEPDGSASCCHHCYAFPLLRPSAANGRG